MIIPLSKLQKQIMSEFYSIKKTKVVYNKTERNKLWSFAKSDFSKINVEELKEKCPALAHQILRSRDSGNNIQSAVFSECAYAQTLANMLDLPLFVNCYIDKNFVIEEVQNLLHSYGLVPRYAYSNNDKTRMLIQAGGCGGIDSALITVWDLNIYTIEFKERGAKASEHDLPKYQEDGKLVITQEFLELYPHFEEMLNQHKELNFFQIMGHNVNSFTKESISFAVANSYSKKYADVICTEDANGYLVMIPANQIPLWANLVGEIRPSGRNSSSVWTPKSLKKFLLEKNASVDENNKVRIKKDCLNVRKPRGGKGTVSGYKVNPLFFVYKSDCKEEGDFLEFSIEKVRQLNPTISAKIYFQKLKYDDVQEYYSKLMQE